MQKLPVYLYTNLYDVTLDLDHNREIRQIMYQRPLKIQKGVRNTVQLQFKNSEQRKIDISSQTFVLNVLDEIEHTLVMSKSVTVLDTGTVVTRGLAEVVFNDSDTINVDSKTYRFSVIKVEDDGSQSPAYTNTYYGAAGTLEVENGIYPVAKPSLEVKSFQRNFNATSQLWEYYSGNLDAHPELKSNTALHTVAYYLTNFKGRVLVEATMENSPGYYGNYALISDTTYTGTSGIRYQNFNGIFSKVRVRYIPTANPATGLNNDTAYSGTFDKLLYRC